VLAHSANDGRGSYAVDKQQPLLRFTTLFVVMQYCGHVLLFFRSLRCQCGLSAYGISDFESVVPLIFLHVGNKSAAKRTIDSLLIESLAIPSLIEGNGG